MTSPNLVTTQRSPDGDPQLASDAADTYSTPTLITIGAAEGIVQGHMLQGYMDRFNSWYTYWPMW